MEGGKTHSVTQATISEYQARVKYLLKRACGDERISAEAYVICADWVIANRAEWSKSTYRKYKAALLYFLHQCKDDEMVGASVRLRSASSDICAKSMGRTSSKKLKKFNKDDMAIFDKWLRDRSHLKWATILRTWLVAGNISGLRPCEWQWAELVEQDGEPMLRVRNAKHTNGRAHGEYRELLLGGLSQNELEILTSHIKIVGMMTVNEGSFEKFYKRVTVFLYRAVRDCWPKRLNHYSLYSLRHQFTADAKASSRSKTELAAMLGHATDATAEFHYGRTASGRSGETRIRPTNENVAKIRLVAKSRAELGKLENQLTETKDD